MSSQSEWSAERWWNDEQQRKQSQVHEDVPLASKWNHLRSTQAVAAIKKQSSEWENAILSLVQVLNPIEQTRRTRMREFEDEESKIDTKAISSETSRAESRQDDRRWSIRPKDADDWKSRDKRLSDAKKRWERNEKSARDELCLISRASGRTAEASRFARTSRANPVRAAACLEAGTGCSFAVPAIINLKRWKVSIFFLFFSK